MRVTLLLPFYGPALTAKQKIERLSKLIGRRDLAPRLSVTELVLES